MAFNIQQLMTDTICDHQFVRPVKLNVLKGSVPKGIRGTYHKVGPAWRSQDLPIHPFDGDGYITKMRFDDGEVHFQGRYINKGAKKARAFSGPLFSLAGLENPSNTNIIPWGNNMLIAFYEGGAPRLIQEDTLEVVENGCSIGHKGFKDGWPVETGWDWLDGVLRDQGIIGDCINAHPKMTDEGLLIMRLAYRWNMFEGIVTHITFFTATIDNNIVKTKNVNIPGFVYMHDFMKVEDYRDDKDCYAFFHHPLRFSQGDGIATSLVDDDNKVSVLYILECSEGVVSVEKIKKVTIPNKCFTTHHVSAKRISKNVLEIFTICYPGYLEGEGRLVQMLIDLEKEELIEQRVINNNWLEFPVLSDDGSIYVSTLGSKEVIAGEPVLMQDGENTYISVMCYKIQQKNTVLMIFDAELNNICELEFPCAYIPIGLHGTFTPQLFASDV